MMRVTKMAQERSSTPVAEPGAPIATGGVIADHPQRSSPVGGVVVGVDDSASARAAVAWAAAEADRRGVGLHLVEVLPSAGGSGESVGVPHGRARALLFRAQGIARASCPTLAVSMETLSGRVGPALVAYAARATVLVTGSNGPGGPIPLSLGSILGEVTAHAECPVVIVPATEARSRAWGGPVLVALDGTPHGDRAVAFAADAAHRRGVALVTVRAGAGSGPAEEQEPDAAVMARVREEHPGLAVHAQTVIGQPEDALLRSGAGIALIVVPSRHRGLRMNGASGAWTRHFLPILSSCPVAVVSERVEPAASS
jgi:nucleotide-binding universal stress UspA family protein